MLYDLGQWDELLEAFDDIRQVEDVRGAAQPGAMAQGYAAFVFVQRGMVEQASAAAEHALVRGREIEDPQVLVAAAFFTGRHCPAHEAADRREEDDRHGEGEHEGATATVHGELLSHCRGSAGRPSTRT